MRGSTKITIETTDLDRLTPVNETVSIEVNEVLGNMDDMVKAFNKILACMGFCNEVEVAYEEEM